MLINKQTQNLAIQTVASLGALKIATIGNTTSKKNP